MKLSMKKLFAYASDWAWKVYKGEEKIENRSESKELSVVLDYLFYVWNEETETKFSKQNEKKQEKTKKN